VRRVLVTGGAGFIGSAQRRDWWEPIKSGEYREYYRKHHELPAR
jgi:dTDP-D-glucose 4,6-dehydratase